VRSAARALLAAVAFALCAGITAASASASAGPAITDLRVSGGEANWHAVNDFRLDWAAAGEPPVAAVHYQVRAESGEMVLPARRIAGGERVIEHIHLPSGPGLHRAEVWLEAPGGETGPVAVATLRFDDAAPGSARLLAPNGWISGRSPAIARIERPTAPLPVSGIRGYAISVDRGTASSPCAAMVFCTPAETDLGGGIADETAVLGLLPEGLSFVRVVAVSGSGVPSARVESTTLRVDATYPALELRGVPAGWSDRPVTLTANASDGLSGMRAAGPTGPYTAIAIGGQTPAVAPGDTVSATARGDGAHVVAFYARDAAGNVADGAASAPSPRRAIVRVDETPPRVAFARAQVASEPERIEATVTDALSGADPGRGAISVRPAGSGQPFASLATAVSAGRLVAHWDSDRYPPGRYEFRATGFDVAGNQAVGDRRLGGARVILPNPLKAPTELVSGFGGRRLVWHRCVRREGSRHCRRETIEDFERRPRSRTVPYGRGTAFGGRLASATGAPLAGLPVVVTETFAAGADPASRETVARTGADGTFLVRLAPGPSRRVEARFAGSRLLSGSGGRAAWFGVRSSIRLRASAATAVIGGAPIEFTGRVGGLGTSIPAGGMPVELQFRLPGSPWREFRTVQTDAAGRFRYSYAFTDDDSRGVRFQFRAHLPELHGWPYEPAASRPVLVTGR
jgi:hypothetical protein